MINARVLALFVLTFMSSDPLSGFSAAPATQAQPASNRRQLRAGAATSNITPRLGTSINGYFNDRAATHVHDELHARCLVLDNGETRIVIAVCDSCMIPRTILDSAKRIVQEKSGLPASQILISATHTHTAPTATGAFLSEPDPRYLEFLTERIADGVLRAIHNLTPARIAWGSGQEPNDVFNRRWKMKPGTIAANPLGGTNDLVKMNPAMESPNLVEPAGPTDPEVAVLSIQTADGKPLALLANYSLHYIGTDSDNEISADYYGAFADRIQELLRADRQDPPFVAMLSNGTSGNINNINFRKKRAASAPYERVRTVADIIANEALRVSKDLKYSDWVPLRVEQRELALGVRRPDAAEVGRAEAIVAKAKGRPLRTSEEVYAHETMLMKDYPPEVSIILQGMRIGDLGIAAIPCEVFAETGLAIKKNSPLKQTFTIELANGCSGYLPTPEQHKLGGYETWRARTSFLEVEAEPKIREAVLELLGEVARD
jgi:hypothetical protein